MLQFYKSIYMCIVLRAILIILFWFKWKSYSSFIVNTSDNQVCFLFILLIIFHMIFFYLCCKKKILLCFKSFYEKLSFFVILIVKKWELWRVLIRKSFVFVGVWTKNLWNLKRKIIAFRQKLNWFLTWLVTEIIIKYYLKKHFFVE